jgi:hypothetical protein
MSLVGSESAWALGRLPGDLEAEERPANALRAGRVQAKQVTTVVVHNLILTYVGMLVETVVQRRMY